MLPAIQWALDGQNDHSRLRQVVFITDGNVSNEAELFQKIAARLGDTRFFTVGIGSAPNQHFMRRAAKYGRGTFTFIGNLDQAESRMKELLQKLSRPVVTHLSIRPAGEGFVEAYPKMIPDLFIGEPVVIAFRFSDKLKTLEVRGQGPNGQWVEDLNLENALEGKGIPRLWAREKIDDLESSVYWGAFTDEVRKEASGVALKYELVTRYTSLVAVDETPVRGAEKKYVSKNMPTNLPFGWKYAKVFGSRNGEGMPLMHKILLKEARNFYQTTNISLKHMVPVVMLQNKTASAATKSLALPQTATPSQLYLIIGLIDGFP
jgi:Ca-activated chloride channel family protein